MKELNLCDLTFFGFISGKSTTSYFFLDLCLRKRTFFFFQVGKRIILRKKRETLLSKNFEFFRKKLFFLILKNKVLTYLILCKNYGRHRVSNSPPVGYLTTVPHHLCIMLAARASARVCSSWAKSGEGKKF